ncbi:hypothetical protein J25TS5_50760 [Paenibacillus faecis]|nr:hypothetical protein J25TS5_50760 [Paenibacillus faecis]
MGRRCGGSRAEGPVGGAGAEAAERRGPVWGAPVRRQQSGGGRCGGRWCGGN